MGAIIINKIDAARSQLDTAIQLWFQGADPVSIHTLVYAACEIIHVVSKKRGRTETLIFDNDRIRPEAKELWYKLTRRPATFFKHASRDPNAEIEFRPEDSEFFIAMSIHGLSLGNIPPTVFTSAYMAWLGLNRPDLLEIAGQAFFENLSDVKQKDAMRKIPKIEFLQRFIKVHGPTFGL